MLHHRPPFIFRRGGVRTTYTLTQYGTLQRVSNKACVHAWCTQHLPRCVTCSVCASYSRLRAVLVFDRPLCRVPVWFCRAFDPLLALCAAAVPAWPPPVWRAPYRCWCGPGVGIASCARSTLVLRSIGASGTAAYERNYACQQVTPRSVPLALYFKSVVHNSMFGRCGHCGGRAAVLPHLEPHDRPLQPAPPQQHRAPAPPPRCLHQTHTAVSVASPHVY